jgi:hypothetical protein
MIGLQNSSVSILELADYSDMMQEDIKNTAAHLDSHKTL